MKMSILIFKKLACLISTKDKYTTSVWIALQIIITLPGEDTLYKEIFILELLLFFPSAPIISGQIPEWANYIILNVSILTKTNK